MLQGKPVVSTDRGEPSGSSFKIAPSGIALIPGRRWLRRRLTPAPSQPPGAAANVCSRCAELNVSGCRETRRRCSRRPGTLLRRRFRFFLPLTPTTTHHSASRGRPQKIPAIKPVGASSRPSTHCLVRNRPPPPLNARRSERDCETEMGKRERTITQSLNWRRCSLVSLNFHSFFSKV